jgi:hypothetical protein
MQSGYNVTLRCAFSFRYPARSAHAHTPYCHLWSLRLYHISPYRSFTSVTTKKSVIFQEKLLKVLKCYKFLWVQQRHKCSPAASFVKCVMTLYLLKVHLQTFLSIPITRKCRILSCDPLVANERNYLINGMIFGVGEGGGVTKHKMCVLIFCTAFIWNIYHSKVNWARCDQKCILATKLYSRRLKTKHNYIYIFFSYNTVPQTDTNTETGGCMYDEGLLMMSAWRSKHAELYTYR